MNLDDIAKGLFRISIDISKFFGLKEGEFVVTLREPTEDEITALRNAEGEQRDKRLMKLWKDCLIESTITKEDGTPADVKVVAGMIAKSSSAAFYVIQEFMSKLPLASLSAGKSETLQELSLKVAE